MRIVLEATAACRPNRMGVARYTIGLVDALLAQGQDLRLGYRLSRWRRRGLRYLPAGAPALWLPERFLPRGRRCEVVHGTDAWVPTWRGAASVATLHDMFGLLFDDGMPARLRERRRRAYQRLAEQCDRLIAVSAATRDDFLRLIDFPADRVDVVHAGIDASFRPRPREETERALVPYRLPPHFALYVGEISRRKNIPGLVQGFAASAVDKDLHLVIAGSLAAGAREALAPIAASGVGPRVHLLGYVPQDVLPSLYARADAFLFPTLYEGFGLPALEAMASGTPVLAGARGASPEVTGGHAVLVDPSDVDAIAAGIEQVLQHPEEARLAAQRHAQSFTWDRCAQETLAVYARACGQARQPG